MKSSILLAGLILLTSGCLHQGGFFGGLLSQFTVPPQEETTLVEEIAVTAEAVPPEVVEENLITFFFTVENKGNTTADNVTLSITDACLFRSNDTLSRNLGRMEPGDVEELAFDGRMGTTLAEQSCEIRYQTVYLSNATGRFDFVAMSEEEFVRRSRGGEEADDIDVFYRKTKTPVDIVFSISKDQPVQSGDDFFAYFQFFDRGDKGITLLNKDDVKVRYPSKVAKLTECDDLVPGQNATLTPSRDLRLADQATKVLTCKMEAADVSITEKGQFEVDVRYKYTLRDSIVVRIVPE